MKPRFVTKEPVRSRHGALARLAGPATMIVDLDGRISQWSTAAADLFGPAADQVIGHDLAELLIEPDDRGRVKEALAEAADGRRWYGILPTRGADGRASDIEFCWDPLTGLDGYPMVMVSAYPALELAGGPGADIGQERLALLTEASSRIGSRLEIEATASELMDVAVPRFADAAGICVQERLITSDEFPERETDGAMVVRRLAVGVADLNPADWETAFPIDEVTVYPAWTPYAQCMETGRPILFTRLDSAMAEGIGLRVWRRDAVFRVLDHTSFMVVPLKARGRVLGFVVFTRRPDSQEFDDSDVALAEELAARTAVCIDNARLYNRERRTALTLQSSLLPAGLRAPLGLTIAHRYLPASDLTGVGGDWYDVIPLQGSRVALVVGDVMGHGTRAAATMGQLRTAVRTLAGLDLTPAELIFRLDQMTQDMDATQIATCVYAIYDPVARSCSLARAGHVPPILLHADSTTEIIDTPAGLPLGIGGEAFTGHEVLLADGDTLILCTDGLVESRERDIDAGVSALRAILERGAGRGDLERLCDLVIQALRPNHDRDDIALLVARVRTLTPDHYASAVLPGDPASVHQARELVRTTLAGWHLGDLVDTTELLISELVTNAVQHGHGAVEVRLLRGATLICEVSDRSPVSPLIRTPHLLEDAGRGMQLINWLAQRWGTRRVPDGKIVWCELALAPPEL